MAVGLATDAVAFRRAVPDVVDVDIDLLTSSLRADTNDLAAYVEQTRAHPQLLASLRPDNKE